MYQFVSCDQSTNLDFNFYHRTLNSTHRNVNIARFGTRVKSAFNPMNRQLLASNSNVTHPLATASTRSINLFSAKCGCANTTPLFFTNPRYHSRSSNAFSVVCAFPDATNNSRVFFNLKNFFHCHRSAIYWQPIIAHNRTIHTASDDSCFI